MNRITIHKHEWDEKLKQLLSSFEIYAPVENEFSSDYVLLDANTIPEAVYNKPKPVTPLKKFFLPVKENVTSGTLPDKPVIIIGAPNCDVMALAFLDEIYLEKEYPDPVYQERRKNTILISADCLSIQEHCHCNSYGIEPRGNEHSDLSVALLEDSIILSTFNKKGEEFLDKMGIVVSLEPEKELVLSLEKKHKEVLDQLKNQNAKLPDYRETGTLVAAHMDGAWKRHSSTCVSCGACSAICPTCSCFLLVDKPGFEKVRQLDTCQYPGFERVAGGDDALRALSERFRNRYLCKYVWKPEKFKHKACTGCGRCIETCIGKINKNELFVELSTA